LANLMHILGAGAGAATNSSGGVVPADAAGGADAAVQPGAPPPPGSLPAGVVTAGAARHGRLATREQQPSSPAIAADRAAGRLPYNFQQQNIHGHVSQQADQACFSTIRATLQMQCPPVSSALVWVAHRHCVSAPCRHQLVVLAAQDIVPPALMVPERRLEVLVEQALMAQLSAAMFHNRATAAVSLLTDYRAGTEHIPTRTVQVGAAISHGALGKDPQDCLSRTLPRLLVTLGWYGSVKFRRAAGQQVLQEHNDEVWHVAFSPDGTQLASSSKDGTACVWQVGGCQLCKRRCAPEPSCDSTSRSSF
jgi:WD domain, G-beta repeat